MAIELCANTVGGHLFRATVTFAVTGSYDFFSRDFDCKNLFRVLRGVLSK